MQTNNDKIAVRRKTRRGLFGFRRSESGATAVEFGLVALPFIVTLFAILETALVFFATQVLETATGDAARLIRTGQAQQQGLSEQSFKNEICRKSSTLFDCDGGLKVDVRTFTTFDSIDLTNPVDDQGNLRNNFTYSPGNGGDIVIVRAFYAWPIYARLFGFDLTNMPNGKRLLAATTAFKNEPFPW